MGNNYLQPYLFEQIAEGDEKAFRKVFHELNARLYPFILKWTRSAAVTEDIIQEVFLRLWINREEVAKMEKPVSWIFRVASNLSLSWLRAEIAEIKRLEKIKEAARKTEEQSVEMMSFKETEYLINKAVSLLPPRRQLIYRLSREQGLDHKEIAEKLQLSPNTIKNQLVSALKFIKEYLQRMGDMAIPVLFFLFLN